ncbi:hypothetical protein HMPREF2526_05945 [Corynebacterium sp. HMSC070E08]|nr:hypothetical protein HMPREF2526_05945 [Corynebacterium sp. HMSC070E08]
MVAGRKSKRCVVFLARKAKLALLARQARVEQTARPVKKGHKAHPALRVSGVSKAHLARQGKAVLPHGLASLISHACSHRSPISIPLQT